jgi:hypothetical protein
VSAVDASYSLSGDADLPRGDNLADLLGPKPEPTMVLWVFRDLEDHWCVRQEGGRTEMFASRDKAAEFARLTGRVWGSYRLFLGLRDGRVAQELFNLRE